MSMEQILPGQHTSDNECVNSIHLEIVVIGFCGMEDTIAEGSVQLPF